jgi:outer membrane protein assembly factor BamB
VRYILPLLFLASCSGLKPGPSREAAPLVQRGWASVESSLEVQNLDAGASQVSYAGPVLAGNKVLYGSERFGITVLAKKNGRVLWRKKISDGVASMPLAHGNKVFAGGEAGAFYALDLETGKTLWETSLGGPVKGEILFAFDRLFVATADEGLHSLDPSTGRVLWTYRRPAFSGTSVKGGGSPAAIGGQIWAGFTDGALVALNPQSGALELEKMFRDNLKFMDLDAKVVGWKEGLLVSTYDGKLRYIRKDGTLLWEFAAGGARAPLVTAEGVIYLPSSDGAVYAIQGSSGKEIWKSPLARGVPTSLALAQKGPKEYLLVGGSEERLVVVDPASGKQLGSATFGRGSGSYSPIAVDQESGSFYMLSSYSRIYQFHLN